MPKEPPQKKGQQTVSVTPTQEARVQRANIFTRAQSAQNAFNRVMRENGYEPFTTFYSDLTIAEPFGASAIRDTHRNVTRSWGNDVKYYTEYVMSLNHKIWEHYNNGNEAMARVYDDLWRKAASHAEKTFKGEDLKYYYRVTD